MRLLFFLFLITYTLKAQLSSSISYNNTEIVETTSHVHTNENFKYIGISNLYTSPTGKAKKEIEISKLSACNDILWSKNYKLQNANLEHRQIILEQGTDNIFLIGFYTPNTTTQKYLYVQKIDSEGAVLFAKSYDFGNYLMGNSYSNFSTSTGFVVTAKYAPLGGGASYTTLISIKNNGDLEYAFRQKDTFTGISASQVNDDTYFIRSGNLIYLSDKNGSIYWAKSYPYLLQSSNFFNALYVEDGYVVSVRRNTEYYLVKFDLDGNYIWKTDLKETGYWPILYNVNNQIGIASFININGAYKPLLITYNSDGENINEQILNNLNISTYGAPSVYRHHNNLINISYSASSTNLSPLKTILFNENIHASSCLESIELPEVDNLTNPLFNLTQVQSTALVLSSQTDHQLTESDVILLDTIRCSTPLLPDTITTEVSIDCTVGYSYSGTDQSATYFWPHNGSTNPDQILDTAGIYEVVIENCHSITHEFVEVKDYCHCDLFIPNAFSPNQDQLNDTFGAIDNCNVTYYKLEIYDRWGKRLFKTEDINVFWDGTYNQEMVKSDVYFYTVEYTPASSNSLVKNAYKQGSVLVVY